MLRSDIWSCGAWQVRAELETKLGDLDLMENSLLKQQSSAAHGGGVSARGRDIQDADGTDRGLSHSSASIQLNSREAGQVHPVPSRQRAVHHGDTGGGSSRHRRVNGGRGGQLVDIPRHARADADAAPTARRALNPRCRWSAVTFPCAAVHPGCRCVPLCVVAVSCVPPCRGVWLLTVCMPAQRPTRWRLYCRSAGAA